MCTPMLPSRRVAPVPESIPAGRLPSRPSTPVAAVRDSGRGDGHVDAVKDTGDDHVTI